MNEDHFDKLINLKLTSIKEDERVLRDSPEEYKRKDLAFLDLYFDYFTILFAKYSRGFEINFLKNDSKSQLLWYIKYRQEPTVNPVDLTDISTYVNVLQMYSIGYLISEEPSIVNKFLAIINQEGQDSLFDLIAGFTNAERKQEKSLIFPKAYAALWAAIQSSDPSLKANNMHKFLSEWYKNMKDCAWHNSHKSPGKSNFRGYWCWEAALVTVLYDIDDSSYRDMNFYPKDVVTFARIKKRESFNN